MDSELNHHQHKSWEDFSSLCVDNVFNLVVDNKSFETHKSALMSEPYGLFFGDDQVGNMKSIIEKMIEEPIWKYDVKSPNYTDSGLDDVIKKTQNLLWEMLAACSIIYFDKTVFGFGSDSEMHLYSYKNKIKTTLVKKQKDYGPKNIEKFGINGIVIRIYDKIARLENLLNKNSFAENEPLQDTLLDIVGYSIIAVMWNNNYFMAPMVGESGE